MLRRHRSAVALASLAVACGPGREADTRVEIRAHWWPRCQPGRPPSEVAIDLEALGDFDPGPDTSQGLDESGPASAVAIPESTEAVRLVARDGFSRWIGLGPRSEDAPIDVSLWPEDDGCVVFEGSGEYPGAAVDQAFGIAADGTTLVFGGGASTASATSAILGHLDQARLARANLDPRESRSGARITRYGDTLLVSGGTDPRAGGAPLDTAEVLDVGAERFADSPIALSAPRADHAAVTLPDGDSLLVGGRGEGGTALPTLEVVSPSTGRFRIAGLADLSVGRIDPTVAVMTDGSVVVLGGTDGAGEPLASVEWLSPDLTDVERLLDTIEPDGTQVIDRAIAPLPGGGFVAAGGCAVDPATPPDAACLPATSALWVTRDGSVTELPGAVEHAPQPTFVPGEAGRPWLATGDREEPQLLRFNPWADGSVGAPWFESPSTPPRTVPSTRATVTAWDANVVVWLERPGPSDDDPARVVGYRHSARSEFSTDVAPLIRGGAEHLAPDTVPGDRVRYDPVDRTLGIDDAAVTVWVTGVTFDDLGLSISRRSGPAPIVVLGEARFGSGDCPWPAGAAESDTFRLARAGDRIELAVADRVTTCLGPAGRVPVGLSTNAEGLVLETLTLRREARLDVTF